MQGGRRTAAGELPLLRLIDGIRQSEDVIVARVEERRAKLGAETGLTGLALAERLATDLTADAAWKSALIGAGAALPYTLPLLGFLPSLVLKLALGALLQVANEVELVLAIAAAYRTRLSSDRLRTVAFWLVQLSNFDDLQSRALAMGVRVTVRRLVEKLVAVGLSRALEATATGMMAGMVRGAAPPGEPWYIRATSLLGVPVVAYLGWRSTRSVWDRAIAYFSEELAVAR